MFILFLTIGIVAIVVLLFLMIFSPSKTGNIVLSQGNNLDPTMSKLLKMFGGDIYALLSPNIIRSQTKSSSVKRIFLESGNPWKITFQEFFILRIILGVLGIIVSISLIAFMSAIKLGFLGIFVCPLFPYLFYNYPVNYYKDIANKRNLQFKAQLPEAIDYLIMALSGGGYALPTAFEEATKYIQNGIIKDEFMMIVNDLRAGKTMEASLNSFADRAPTEGIKSFTKALNNANKQSVSMVEILRARAYASRKDLETEIEKRVSTLPTRVTLILSPTSAISIGIVAIAPSLYTISTLL